MRVVRRNFDNVSRQDEFKIHFLGDTHVGHPGVFDKVVKRAVARVADDPQAYWIGMGDQVHAINTKDARFDPDILPDWVLRAPPARSRAMLGDLVTAQRQKFMELHAPIAHKCLGLLEGNHEQKVRKWTERNVHQELCDAMCVAGDFEPGTELNVGYSGFIKLSFARGVKNGRRVGVSTILLNCHHGATIGEARHKEYILTTDADIVAWGHSHKIGTKQFRIRSLAGDKYVELDRWGLWTGTFQQDSVVDQTTWGETKGHLSPVAGIIAVLRPGAQNHNDRIYTVQYSY